jgi:Cd2+/Zn2+-exporting ATPase
MIAEFALGLPMIGWPLVFFLATYFFGGFFTFRTAIASTLRGKFEVDFLMLVAAIGAALIGRWAEGAVLLFLFSLGHALEEYALSRASKSIESLAELAPAARWCAGAKRSRWRCRWRRSSSATSSSSARTPASPQTAS